MLVIMFIALVKAGLTGLNPEQVLSLLGNVIAALNGNTNFPVTNPTLLFLEGLFTQLSEAVNAAVDGGKSRIALRNAVVKQVRIAFTTLAADINEQCNGDAIKAATSGMLFRATKVPAGLLGPVARFRGVALGNGRIKLMWGGLKGRSSYVVYSTLEFNTQPVWEFRGQTSKNRIILEGLEPGVMYFFKVAGVNNYGTGEFSLFVQVRCV